MIQVLSIGQKPDSWITEGMQEYLKRLPGIWQTQLKELPLSAAKTPSQAQKAEAKTILPHLNFTNGYVIGLSPLGETLDSQQLSQLLQQKIHVFSSVQFIIGGPTGVDPSLLTRCHKTISLSKLTFPHALVRVILAEAIYRSFTIASGHPYHK